MQKIPKDSVFAVVDKLGPCQPIDIRKELKLGDTFLIGALLSELVADKRLAISAVRRGGSPFYYDPQKPERLETLIKYCNEKDRRTLAQLKEVSVLREDAVEPLVRVGLKSLPDFSLPLVMPIDGQEVGFWRYFLVGEADARKLANALPSESAPAAASDMQSTDVAAAVVVTRESITAPVVEASSGSVSAVPSADAQTAAVVEAPKVDSAQQDAKPKRKRATKKKPASDDVPQQTLAPSTVLKIPSGAMHAAPTAQAVQSPDDWLSHDTLYERVQQYAVKTKAVISQQTSVKPNSELTCVLTDDGPHGKLSVLVLALNKKKVAEKDITRSLLHARGLGMPLVLLPVEPLPDKLSEGLTEIPNVTIGRF
jgi:hypothetical protein